MTHDRPGHIVVSINPAQQRRRLVVAESFHEGWRAQIDGRPATVVRADGDFIGCDVPAGSHQVVLRFQPQGLRHGKLLTGLGLSLMVSLFAIRSVRALRAGGAR